MKNLDFIAEELFNKIRGRFPSVTIGDGEGNVTNIPKDARFFDFEYKESGKSLGKVSISLEEKSISVMYSNDFVANEDQITQDNWYNFLRELRQFSRKRLLNFDTRNITKSNLDRRDYKFLATNRAGEEQMTESKLYGTSRVSYQDFGGSRIVIKHTESVNQELATGRTQKIGKIYVESSEGERFMYPYKHLSGARAMARHVAEGGKPFDDFGQHITGLSEELAKLRKFKTYMGRSAVMAESLAGYMDVVKERIATVKKTVESLQRPAYYKEAVEGFEKPVLEDVPSDVAENWIDQLTIKQFNEELQDIFPYIYNLVSEATRAKELGPDELDEGILDWVKSKWEEFKMNREQSYQDYLNDVQLLTNVLKSNGYDERRANDIGNRCLNEPRVCLYNEIRKKGLQTGDMDMEVQRIGNDLNSGWTTRSGTTDEAEQNDPPTPQDNPPTPQPTSDSPRTQQNARRGNIDNVRGPAETVKVRQGQTIHSIAQALNDQNNMGGDVQEFVKDIMKMNKITDPRSVQTGQVLQIPYSMGAGRDGASRGLPPGGFTAYEQEIENAFEELMGQFSESNDCDETCPKSCPDCGGTGDPEKYQAMKAKEDDDTIDVKMTPDGGIEKADAKDQKTPLGEFILSHFDYTTGQFPKGETAVLTMVEKDYGERFIEPAKQFIERINTRVAEVMGYREEEPVVQDNTELDSIRSLAGL